MPAMPRQPANTVVSSSGLLNVYAAEIERAIAGIFANLTNTSRPRFLLTRSSTFTIGDHVDAVIPWQIVVTDPRGMWTASAPDIVTIKDAGDWLFFGQERWPASAAGIRSGKIMKNGTDPGIPGVVQSSNNLTSVSVGEGTTMGFFASCRVTDGDIMRLNGWQNSTVDQNLQTDYGGTFFGGNWLGP